MWYGVCKVNVHIVYIIHYGEFHAQIKKVVVFKGNLQTGSGRVTQLNPQKAVTYRS